MTSVVVTYTGDPAVPGGATIDPGATAGVGIHGNLNDLVDASDVAGAGVAAGVDNCAGFTGSGGGIPGSTGAFAGTACAELPIENRDAGTSGSKTSSQTDVPIDQPVLFTMTTTNNGNLPLNNLVVADPQTGPDGRPPLTPAFNFGRFLGADVQPVAMASRVTIDVYTPTGGWEPLDGFAVARYPLVIGVRATIAVLAPTESFDLRLEMISRDPTRPVPGPVTNCYGVTAAGGEYVAQQYCGPTLQPQPVDESAVINKAISPGRCSPGGSRA